MSVEEKSGASDEWDYAKAGRELRWLVRAGRVAESSRLLEARPELLWTTNHLNGRTSLLEAAWEGQDEAVALLLRFAEQHGGVKAREALVNATDNEGKTALLAACIGGGEHDTVGCVNQLLEAGATQEIPSDSFEQVTPLIAAARRGHCGIVTSLLRDLKAQATCTSTPTKGFGQDALETHVEWVDRWGHNPLWYACAHNWVGVVVLLLREGKAQPWVAPQSESDEKMFPRPVLVAEERRFYHCSDMLHVVAGHPSRAFLLHKARTFSTLAANGERQDVDPVLEVVSPTPHPDPKDPKEQERGEVLAWALDRADNSLFTRLLDTLRTEDILHPTTAQPQHDH